MMKILSERKYVKQIKYRLSFVWRDDPNSGFVFDCDKEGNVYPLNPAAQVNYDKCRNGEYDVISEGVREFDMSYYEDAVGECDNCHSEVVLGMFTNTCRKCGADYNSFGQLLAPREQWGEETGEKWPDIYF